jgi:glycosyltransferase involved in cell wall biosynthesis
MKPPLAIVAVTNDLTTDQRAHRTCLSLGKAGYRVILTGRRQRTSLSLSPRNYQTNRIRLLFERGFLFYAEYNIRLFFYLITSPFSLVVTNDLDTLPAGYCAYRFRQFLVNFKSVFIKKERFNRPLQHLHDCHEYFRGVPELVGRSFVLRMWKLLEDWIFPKLTLVVAVNESVAALYHTEYGRQITVVRNVPLRIPFQTNDTSPPIVLKPGQHIIIYQGAVNIGRGVEEAILAMKYLATDAVLVIAGTGDIIREVQELAIKEGVADKVCFTGQIPFAELTRFTRLASVGLSIEKDISINYHYCLPNKFMDYIQSHVPVLVSALPEMKRIVDHYNIGEFLISHDPPMLANQLDAMLNDKEKLKRFKGNLALAADELCWENEEPELLKLLSDKPNLS